VLLPAGPIANRPQDAIPPHKKIVTARDEMDGL
jgi:hypothetical protein